MRENINYPQVQQLPPGRIEVVLNQVAADALKNSLQRDGLLVHISGHSQGGNLDAVIGKSPPDGCAMIINCNGDTGLFTEFGRKVYGSYFEQEMLPEIPTPPTSL